MKMHSGLSCCCLLLLLQWAARATSLRSQSSGSISSPSPPRSPHRPDGIASGAGSASVGLFSAERASPVARLSRGEGEQWECRCRREDDTAAVQQADAEHIAIYPFLCVVALEWVSCAALSESFFCSACIFLFANPQCDPRFDGERRMPYQHR